MQLKRYEAPTIHEALKKIKAELGDNAVIFSSKTHERSAGRARKFVEVTAAVDRKHDANLHTIHAGCVLDPALSESPNGEKAPMIEENALFSHTFKPRESYAGDGMRSFAVPYRPYLKNLLSSGFNHDIACYLIGAANAEYRRDNNSNSISNILLQQIAYRLPLGGAININPQKRKIVALIGPTGVGKTTTLAKIAARCLPLKGIKVKIITIDTYRIAAAEQLKIYGKIMDLPVAVAATPADLKREIEARDDYNLILIDTPGMNYREKGRVNALNSWLGMHKEVETHLLLSATTSESVLDSTIQCFDKSMIDRFIITKIDESVTMGHLYNIAVSSKVPISYITTGQRVPEDIKPASAQVLSGFFLNGFRNS